MRIGIFGGTFDPPHIGHQILAGEALDQLKLDQVIWVLTPDSPHKKLQKITNLTDRLRMVELAIADNPGFILSRIDIDRQPPHYAVDTLQLLHDTAPNDEFFYVMGWDSLNDLPTWHNPADFVSLCQGIAVMLRQGEDLDISNVEAEIPGLGLKLHLLKTPTIEISGSDIRTRVKKGKQFRYFVPENVYQYILENHLYHS